jgi:hypothetical protein
MEATPVSSIWSMKKRSQKSAAIGILDGSGTSVAPVQPEQ